MKANTNSIKPLIEEFQHIISLIKLSDFKSYEEILKQVEKESIHIPRLIKQIHDVPFSFYRVRSEKDHFDISNVGSFKHPPRESCKSYGRANFPYEPVFYCAINPETAIKEARIANRNIEEGDELYLSESKITKKGIVNMACVFFDPATVANSLYHPMSKSIEDEFLRMCQKEEDFDVGGHQQYFHQVAECFTEKGGDYRASAFIAHNFLYDAPEMRMCADLICYPSVANGFNSLNFAFNPDFVDRHMTLVSVQAGSFSNCESNGFNINTNKFCDIVNGEIRWYSIITKFYYDNYRVEFQFVDDPSEGFDANKAVFYINADVLDFKSLVKYIIDKNFEKLKSQIPPINIFDLNFEQQYHKVGIKPNAEIFAIHNNSKHLVESMNISLNFQHYKEQILCS